MFIPHHVLVQAEQQPAPSRVLVVLHGIYGRGGNWRAFARKLCERRPDWGVLLVDLRMHGSSHGAPAPHSVQACAEDVLALLEGGEARATEYAILGHSFGGKVALDMRRIAREQDRSLGDLWIIDSSPSSRPGAMGDPANTVVAVLRTLGELPLHFAKRDDFVDAVVERGYPRGLALWLAMNLSPTEAGYQNTLSVDAMTQLLRDYFDRDLWSELEAGGKAIHFVRASKGSTITPEDERRLQTLAADAPVHVYELPGSHWLHVDALEELVALVAGGLP